MIKAYIQELFPLNHLIVVSVNLGKHFMNLLLSYISFAEIQEDLLKFISIHSSILICIVELESMLEFYRGLINESLTSEF